MRNLDNLNIDRKVVLVRCDFNVFCDKNGKILDDYRIRSAIPTIEHLLKKEAKVVLMTHFEKKGDMLPVVRKLEDLLKKKVSFLTEYKERAKNEIEKSGFGEIFLLKNLREFKGEEENDESFAEELSSLGEVYVNDAFSVCHRSHASLVGLPKFLPHCAGLWLAKEVGIFLKVKENPWRPLVVIIGGAKVGSKIKSLPAFLEMADHIILGGKLVNEVLAVKGVSLNISAPERSLAEEIKKINLTSPKLHMPVDVLASPSPKGEFYIRNTAPGMIRKEEEIFDIGQETIRIYSEIIKNAKMIIWAGPMGLFEEKKFEKGTREIARAVSLNHAAFKIVGGGDTGAALTRFGFREGIDHISTGGGAMLNFLSGKELPGLRALYYYGKN